jgi:hypothetical protein
MSATRSIDSVMGNSLNPLAQETADGGSPLGMMVVRIDREKLSIAVAGLPPERSAELQGEVARVVSRYFGFVLDQVQARRPGGDA